MTVYAIPTVRFTENELGIQNEIIDLLRKSPGLEIPNVVSILGYDEYLMKDIIWNMIYRRVITLSADWQLYLTNS